MVFVSIRLRQRMGGRGKARLFRKAGDFRALLVNPLDPAIRLLRVILPRRI